MAHYLKFPKSESSPAWKKVGHTCFNIKACMPNVKNNNTLIYKMVIWKHDDPQYWLEHEDIAMTLLHHNIVSELNCISLFCIVWYCIVSYCNVFLIVAMCCSVLQWIVSYCNVFQCFAMNCKEFHCIPWYCSELQRIILCCK